MTIRFWFFPAFVLLEDSIRSSRRRRRSLSMKRIEKKIALSFGSEGALVDRRLVTFPSQELLHHHDR